MESELRRRGVSFSDKLRGIYFVKTTQKNSITIWVIEFFPFGFGSVEVCDPMPFFNIPFLKIPDTSSQDFQGNDAIPRDQ